MGFDLSKMIEELKLDEGRAPNDKGYQCSAKKWTIGYGHNIETTPIPDRIAEDLLSHDIGVVLSQCERFDWFYPLSDVRKRVIVNMVFNMGANGVSSFGCMIAAIKREDWEDAAWEMLNTTKHGIIIDSKWLDDVGDRARRLARMMEYDRDEG